MNELEQAREWAALWKRAAKRYRDALHYISGGVVPVSWMPLQEELEAKDAEIERLLRKFAEKTALSNAMRDEITRLETILLESDIAAKDAEIERLRGALEQAQMQERARCLNVINSYVLSTQVKPHGAVGLALAAVAGMIKGSADD